MITLAVDPGISATGIAVFRNKKIIFVGTLRPKSEKEGRLRELALDIQKLATQYKPDLFAIESQFLTAGLGHQLTLPELKGVLMGALMISCPEAKICSVYPNSVLKVIGVTGRLQRKEKKKATQKALKQMYPELATKRVSADAYDAIAIGLYAIHYGKKF